MRPVSFRIAWCFHFLEIPSTRPALSLQEGKKLIFESPPVPESRSFSMIFGHFHRTSLTKARIRDEYALNILAHFGPFSGIFAILHHTLGPKCAHFRAFWDRSSNRIITGPLRLQWYTEIDI